MAAAPAISTTSVFVGNLTSETSLDELTSHLGSLNLQSTSASIFEDKNGRSKGCAMIEFAEESQASAAVDVLNGSQLGEKELFARADRGPRAPRVREAANEDATYLYAGNLSRDVKSDDLRSLFAAYGTINYCSVSRRRRDADAQGWGTVQFATVEEASAALDALNGTEFQGFPMSVEVLKSPPRNKKTREPKKAKAAREQVEEEEPVVNNAVLYVGNLSWTTEDADLNTLFGAHGTVVKSEVARDKRHDKSRGWATVEMASEEEAAAVIEALNNYSLHDREIEVAVRRGRRRAAKKEGGRRRRNKSTNSADDDEDRPVNRRRQRRNQGEDGEAPVKEKKKRTRKPKEPEMTVVDNPDCFLYVGNLAWTVTNEELNELFGKYGSVANATITVNRGSGRSRGWGTVEMATQQDAQAAVDALNDFVYLERPLLVRFDTRVTAN